MEKARFVRSRETHEGSPGRKRMKAEKMLGDVGETQEALSIKRAVLERCRQILGENHSNTLVCMNNLASMLTPHR